MSWESIPGLTRREKASGPSRAAAMNAALHADARMPDAHSTEIRVAAEEHEKAAAMLRFVGEVEIARRHDAKAKAYRARLARRDPEARRRMAERVKAYRTATTETTPRHQWFAMVEETAIVRGVSPEMLKHSRIRTVIRRAGVHGEPVWMIADEVVFLAKQLPIAERPSPREEVRRAVAARYRRDRSRSKHR